MEERDIQLKAEQAGRRVRVHQISFPWRGFTDLELACRQVVQGLRLIQEVASNRRRTLFFHCTVGEDRTGMLAGLSRMLEQGWSRRRAFQREMCARGYEAGNPEKPARVVKMIRDELTPLFLRMAEMVEEGLIQAQDLDEAVCEGIADRPVPRGRWQCQPQPIP
jgi:hypothetical protein